MRTPPFYLKKRLLCHATAPQDAVENILDYYTFTPVDLHFRQVPEQSPEHLFYMVGLRETVVDSPAITPLCKMMGVEQKSFWDMQFSDEDENGVFVDSLRKRWWPGDPFPSCGHTYQGKPIVYHPAFRLSCNVQDMGVYRWFEYREENEYGYVLSAEDTLCLSCLGVQAWKNIDFLVRENTFHALTTGEPRPHQPPLESAVCAFSWLHPYCRSLDLRGLTFDKHTNVNGMFEELRIADANQIGLEELVLTPDQYRLFCSKIDAQGTQFGAAFFNDKTGYGSPVCNMAEWEKLKTIICVAPGQQATDAQDTFAQLPDNTPPYVYTPVDKRLYEVAENSPEHLYYRVAFQEITLYTVNRGAWPKDEPLPDTGAYYRGKPVVSLSDHFDQPKLDTSQITKQNVLRYRLGLPDLYEEACLVSPGDKMDFLSVDLSQMKRCRGLLSDTQFETIQIIQPPERYATQPTLTDARCAFHLGWSCKTLDIRGLKFDENTDVTGLFRYTAIANYEYDGDGLQTLVVTPEQYALFTSRQFAMKDRELERLAYNSNVHRQRVEDGSGVREEETQEQARERVNGYLQDDLEGLESREYGSFFSEGLYDNNLGDTARWEALKQGIVIKKLDEPYP